MDYLMVAHEQVLAVDVLQQIKYAVDTIFNLLLIVFSAKGFLSEQAIYMSSKHFWKLIFLAEYFSAVQQNVES